MGLCNHSWHSGRRGRQAYQTLNYRNLDKDGCYGCEDLIQEWVG